MDAHVHKSIVYCSQKVETAHVSQMCSRHAMECYSALGRTDGDADTHLDELRRRYAKSNKPLIQGRRLYDFHGLPRESELYDRR